MTRLSRVAPWLPFPRGTHHSPVRVLVHADTDALRALIARDRVANVFVDSLVRENNSAVPTFRGSVMLGLFADDGVTLAAACWVGSNVVPIEATAEQATHFGHWVVDHQQQHASIFGPAEPTLAIAEVMRKAGVQAQEVRANQPLLTIAGPPLIPASPSLLVSQSGQFDEILLAAAAMFEEEVGYSPFLGGEGNYRRRVAWLISHGYSLSHCEPHGEVIFKADLGAVTPHVTQIQGVWMNPRFRGQGLSAAYMAAVVNLSRQHAPIASLYVNDYNIRARAVYEQVGFEQVGTFATVLF
ncbi:GNAT family N-acetyltransferase [Arthrobacter psychrolactophilus]|uniref:GNAT family N-acetyltransferase n=1 Tax=Arthrobacter psychrolactophilus TaxID=92442 RepID=A0A2V5ILC3_9MICC|nr:GNAT family N-acetyltransferase [Arthrobacter psychrolactophilus]